VKDFFGNLQRPLKPLTSKPILPTAEEIEENTRARSAKMRVATRENK
jgi:16S rRNA (cytosine1402-N4)-methyltransferase